MKAPGALRQNDIIEFIGTLYDGDLHAKRVLSLANAALGVLTSASLAVHAIGQGLAHAQGTLSKLIRYMATFCRYSAVAQHKKQPQIPRLGGREP